ncbi:acylphosphatase [Desulfovibrio litoralis]|uniref:acylphosphatase n=1 Tax=Desulfovibrio litoralis DSM 11393 TaxID=1121455 RepID=A0A1M7TAV7_9BACT|nr:acylphosphatase [Desulfovibrio litoralis]SHN67818.1 acylphosphatase [Desulfovibrio litoralis DSM 11393]
MKTENKLYLVKQYIVSGRVQKVWYRSYVKKHAERLNLKGFVKNLKDGSVEIVACADENNLKIFKNCLYKGSLFSKVNEIKENEIKQADNFNNSFLIID